MLAINHWSYFDGTITHPVPKDTTHPMNVENKAISYWEYEDIVAQYLLLDRLPDLLTLCLVSSYCLIAKMQWDWLNWRVWSARTGEQH